jgi:hypothetical protein
LFNNAKIAKEDAILNDTKNAIVLGEVEENDNKLVSFAVHTTYRNTLHKRSITVEGIRISFSYYRVMNIEKIVI